MGSRQIEYPRDVWQDRMFHGYQMFSGGALSFAPPIAIRLVCHYSRAIRQGCPHWQESSLVLLADCVTQVSRFPAHCVRQVSHFSQGAWRWFDERMLDCCERLEEVRNSLLLIGKVFSIKDDTRFSWSRALTRTMKDLLQPAVQLATSKSTSFLLNSAFESGCFERMMQVEKKGIVFHKMAAIAAFNGADITPYHIHPPIVPPHLEGKEIVQQKVRSEQTEVMLCANEYN